MFITHTHTNTLTLNVQEHTSMKRKSLQEVEKALEIPALFSVAIHSSNIISDFCHPLITFHPNFYHQTPDYLKIETYEPSNGPTSSTRPHPCQSTEKGQNPKSCIIVSSIMTSLHFLVKIHNYRQFIFYFSENIYQETLLTNA